MLAQQVLSKKISQQKLSPDRDSLEEAQERDPKPLVLKNQRKATASRVQSAGTKRPQNFIGEAHPYAENQKRARPQNRPKQCQESGLGNIDEFGDGSGDSETQMIYSGRHTESRASAMNIGPSKDEDISQGQAEAQRQMNIE